MNSSEVLIKARGLTKRYNHLMAVDHIDFDVKTGECVGFLGPNGAGKTTTVRMIYCFLPVTEGELSVAGMDVKTQEREIKGLIGVSPQEDNLDPDFTVIKNLVVYARYFGIPKEEANKRATELLKFFSLEEKRDASIYELSGGMKRRLIIARALINQPRILLLDEPTTGLDPQGRHIVWDEIRTLRKQGVTIILTTHYMDEAEALCDRILVVDNGKIIQTGVPKEMIKQYAGEDVLEVEYDETDGASPKERTPQRRSGSLRRPSPRIRQTTRHLRTNNQTTPRQSHHNSQRKLRRRFPETDREETARMSNWIPKLTYRVWLVWRRNLEVFTKTLAVNFLPALLEPILYLAAFGLGFGALLGSTALPGFNGNYIQFIAPGLIAIAVMYGSFFECTYASFVRMYFQKTFDAIIATPVSVEEVIAGELLWGATRAAINGTIVLAVVAGVGLFFTPIVTSPYALLIPVVAFFGGLLFSSIAMCFTASAKTIDFFNFPTFLFITPMFLVSNTFFPLTIAHSKALEVIALGVFPLTQIVDMARGLMSGSMMSLAGLNPLSMWVFAIAWIAVATLVFFILAIHMMKKKLIK